MPRKSPLVAVATKSSIASLWSLAEINGEITIRLRSQREARNVRSRLYSYRANLRKSALSHTGIEASSLDSYVPRIYPELSETGQTTDFWLLTIDTGEVITFEVLLPEDFPEEDIPHFDLPMTITVDEIQSIIESSEEY